VRPLALAALVIPLGLDLFVPVPESNPITSEKIEIGRRLFADRRLSLDGTVACTSCHDPNRAFTKPDPVSPGVFGRRGRRNAPTVLNRAWGRAFFWDGRMATLESQVLEPIKDPNEMDLAIEEASRRVGLSAGEIANALATYIRSLMSGNSPFDRYINGERAALTAEERDGLRLFQGRGNCTVCHVGPNLTDEKFHNTGIAWAPPDDRSRAGGAFLDDGAAAITHKSEDRGAFKTPTLRDVGRTSPYMHDGSVATLEDVVDHYNRGGRPNPSLDPEIQKLDFSADEKRALVAFLRTGLAGSPSARQDGR
jgi:cytochrome c peroxidase